MSTPAAYFRILRVGYVLVREGVIASLPDEDIPPPVRMAKRLLAPFARAQPMRRNAATAWPAPSSASAPPM